MAKYRARFNDKARSGGVAKRNALKVKRQKQFHQDDSDNEKIEKAQRVHEMARPESDARKRVRMAMQFPEKANAAKKKRVEKYIDKQVRKEEKEELLRKLAESQSHVDKSSLRTLGMLGTGKFRTKDGYEKRSLADLESEEESEGESDGQHASENEHFEPEEESDLSGSANSEQTSSGSEPEVESESEAEHKSTFIDHRPVGPALGSGGFGFSNLPQKKLAKPKKKTTWREKLGIPAAQELLQDSEEEEDSDEDEDEGEIENDSNNASEDNEDSQESNGDEDEDEDEDDSEEEEIDDDDDDDDDDDSSVEESSEESSGKAFMEWAKSLDPEASTPSLPTPKVAGYYHQHRKTEGEEAAEAVDAQKDTPGWTQRLELEPVVLERSEDVNASRTSLPAVASEQSVMDAINHFDVVVITGATGSGKTTQVPQFLFEAGYAKLGMIGVTQPRRVAAVSMAKRIGNELCGAGEVGYQIRFDTKVGKNTAIKLMTDGVLLKEMSSDLLLSKYSSIIVDEAHERSVNTDILIGLLSRVVKLRREKGNPLKLVVMSATLRVSDFTENRQLFDTLPPVVNVESRQHPITNHFSKRTATDYVEEAVKKTRRIHERLPKGGILVFMTGKDEINRVIAELDPKHNSEQTVRPAAGTTTFEEENVEFGGEQDTVIDEEEVDVDDEESDLEMDPEQDPDMNEKHDESKLHVLPLYSLLSTEDQLKVFEPIPRGHRLCVVATNVAETSLTIPGIRYVVDCGRSKQRIYDLQTGVQKYSVRWVSKASADQRSGRSGRMGPGHCYRLYSSAVYERDFPQFGDPEIVRMPVEGLVLQMKSMGINNIMNFPFPTTIPESSLQSGIQMLQNLGALQITEPGSRVHAPLTPLGEKMSLFPLHPRHAKMLLIGNQFGCLPYVVALVAALSVQDLFIDSPKSVPVLDGQADVLQLLSAVAAYSWTPTKNMCEQLGLRPKAMAEVASLREQLARLVSQTLKSDAMATLTAELTKPLAVPTARQLTALRQIVAAGYVDMVVARRALFDSDFRITSRHVSRQPYYTIQAGLPSTTVFIHPQTIMDLAPDFLVYSSMTTNEDTDNVRVRPLTVITETQLSAIAQNTPLLNFSKPLGGAHAPKMIDATTREIWVVPRYGASMGSAGLGWDLPPRKIVQIRQGSKWVNK